MIVMASTVRQDYRHHSFGTSRAVVSNEIAAAGQDARCLMDFQLATPIQVSLRTTTMVQLATSTLTLLHRKEAWLVPHYAV